MYSSPIVKQEIILTLYKEDRSVFRLGEIAMLSGEINIHSLYKKMNYYVRTGKIQSPRKGIYIKPGANPEELACVLFTPSYISLEYVLQRAGIVFQFDSRITAVSYLSRTLDIEGQAYTYRKIKGEILVNTAGIVRQENHINIATAERAFLDLIYLNKVSYFDNLNPLDPEKVNRLLPVYQSKALVRRVNEIMTHG